MEISALVLFGTLALCILIEVPMAFSLGISGVVTILVRDLAPATTIPQVLFGAADSFSLLAIPLFILAGLLMGRSGISRRLVDLADALVGHVRGGLGLVTIAVSIFFAGISGSGPADVAALGLFLVPAMIQAGYSDGFAAALVAAGGGIGIIVPPSIALIVYGVVAEVPISHLSIAGIVPGIVVGLALMVAVRVECRTMAPRSAERRGGPFPESSHPRSSSVGSTAESSRRPKPRPWRCSTRSSSVDSSTTTSHGAI